MGVEAVCGQRSAEQQASSTGSKGGSAKACQPKAAASEGSAALQRASGGLAAGCMSSEQASLQHGGQPSLSAKSCIRDAEQPSRRQTGNNLKQQPAKKFWVVACRRGGECRQAASEQRRASACSERAERCKRQPTRLQQLELSAHTTVDVLPVPLAGAAGVTPNPLPMSLPPQPPLLLQPKPHALSANTRAGTSCASCAR